MRPEGPATMADKFHGKGLESALFTISRWLLAPFVSTITMLILLVAFEASISDIYLQLLATQFFLVMFVFKEAYTESIIHKSILQVFTGAFVPWFICIGLLIFIGFVTKSSADFSRRVLLIWFVQAPLLIAMAQDVANKAIIQRMQDKGRQRRAVIVGYNSLAERLAETINSHAELGINIIGFFEDRGSERVGMPDEAPMLGKLTELADHVKKHNVDVIYFTLPIQQQGRVADLLEDLRDTTASIYLVPDVFIIDLIQSQSDSVGNIPVIALCETPFHGMNGMVKRATDLAFGTIFLTIALPLMILIATGIKITSRGPVIFRQRRYGLDGQEIIVYKFRSMTVTEDSDVINQAKRNDPRITRFGSFLRKSSLDEIPQLINVLQGRMSLVGPRPHAVAHNEMYRQLIKGYMVRHKVLPGITGLAQVEGWRGETEDLEAMQRRIDYDLEYLRNWSLALDLEILFRTVITVWKQKTAY